MSQAAERYDRAARIWNAFLVRSETDGQASHSHRLACEGRNQASLEVCVQPEGRAYLALDLTTMGSRADQDELQGELSAAGADVALMWSAGKVRTASLPLAQALELAAAWSVLVARFAQTGK